MITFVLCAGILYCYHPVPHFIHVATILAMLFAMTNSDRNLESHLGSLCNDRPAPGRAEGMRMSVDNAGLHAVPPVFSALTGDMVGGIHRF